MAHSLGYVGTQRRRSSVAERWTCGSVVVSSIRWLFIWGRYMLHGTLNLGPQLAPGSPMVVSKGIALALDLGTPYCSGGPLAFDLGHLLARGAPGSSKGASLTIDLETSLALGSGQLALDMGPQLAPGAHGPWPPQWSR